MNPISIDRSSEMAGNLVMAAFSLALVAGYFFLFQLFRADRHQSSAAAMEQQVAESSTGSPPYKDSE